MNLFALAISGLAITRGSVAVRLLLQVVICFSLSGSYMAVALAQPENAAPLCRVIFGSPAVRSSPVLPETCFSAPTPKMHEDPYVQTLTGHLMLDVKNLGKTPGNERILVNHRNFDKPLPLTVNFRRDEKGQIVKAPFVVVLVGMHGNAKSDAFDRFITRQLASLGNHVVLLPNSFSDTYALSSPHYPSSSILEEVRIYYDLIRLIQDQGILPSDKISETRIVGYSYGGLIASVLASQSLIYDREAGVKRTIDGDITLVSPPLYLRSAQRSLDDLIGTYETSTLAQNLRALLRLGIGKLQGDHARILMGSKFRQNLIQAMLNFKASADSLRRTSSPDDPPGQLVHKFANVPVNKRDPKFRDFAKESLSYNQAQYQFTESAQFWADETGLLSYWIRKNQEVNGPSITMVAAKDDILNLEDLAEFEKFPLSRDQRNLILLEHGGHGGFVHTQWFIELLRNRFR